MSQDLKWVCPNFRETWDERVQTGYIGNSLDRGHR